jgi:hypothetical protein
MIPKLWDSSGLLAVFLFLPGPIYGRRQNPVAVSKMR